MNSWILGSWVKDLSLFYLAGIVTLLAAPTFSASTLSLGLAILVIDFAIDSGHVYLTAFRLAWRSRIDRFRSLLLLVLIFIATCFWLRAGLRGFWSVVVYFTLFHHFRQFYGISRWYQKKNGVFRKGSDRFLMLLCAGPALAFHFRGLDLSIYSGKELWSYRHSGLFWATAITWVAVLIAWTVYELRLWRRLHHVEWNRLSSIVFPASLGAYCFFVGRNLFEIVFPLIVVHGLSYLALISYAMPIESKTCRPSKAVLTAVITLVVVGFEQTGLHALLESYDYLLPQGRSIGSVLLIAAIVSPTLWHYVMDGLLWKSSDPQTLRIYDGHSGVGILRRGP